MKEMQCANGCHKQIYSNREAVLTMRKHREIINKNSDRLNRTTAGEFINNVDESAVVLLYKSYFGSKAWNSGMADRGRKQISIDTVCDFPRKCGRRYNAARSS